MITPCIVQHKILFTAVSWPSVAVLNRIIYVCGGHKRGKPNRHSRYLPKSNTIKYYNALRNYNYYFYCCRSRRHRRQGVYTSFTKNILCDPINILLRTNDILYEQ